MKSTLKTGFLAIVAIGLTACAGVKQTVQSPSGIAPLATGAMPAAFKNAPIDGAMNTDIPQQWWRVFNDDTLNALQHQLLAGNQTIALSQAQLAQVLATYEGSKQALLPTLSINAASSRSASPSGVTSSNAVNPSNSQSLQGLASWELDVWGRLANAQSAAQQNLQASRADLASATLSAQAALCQTYFSLRTSESQMALLGETMAQYERALKLTQIRYEGGVSPRSDTLQAQIQLNAVKLQWQSSAQQRKQYEHAIAVLLGQAPSSFALPVTGVVPQAVIAPKLLPSELLARRPDLAAARGKLGAALAQQGVAQAAFFPSIILSASVGFRNSNIANLITAPNFLWSLGASAAQAILDGGQRQQAKAQAAAGVDAATATYRQQVLTALQEVEDQLAINQALQSELELQTQTLAQTQQNAAIVAEQYKAGTVNYLNVTTANIGVLNAQSSVLALKNSQLAALNVLLKNVAGRWE